MKLFEPGASIHTFEMNCHLHEDEVDQLMQRAKREEKRDSIWDRRGVRLKVDRNTGWAYVKVNPLKLIEPNCSAAAIIPPDKSAIKDSIKALEGVFKEIGLPNKVSDYEVTRVDSCVNVWAKKNSEAREYLRLQKKRKLIGGMVERPFYDDRVSWTENLICGHDYYRAGSEINDRGEELVFYDKKRQAKRFDLCGADELPAGLLRIERQLDRSALRNIQRREKLSNEKLLCWVAEHSGELILERLQYCYDAGKFCKADEIFKTIENTTWNPETKELARKYVRWSKEKGEEKAAEKVIKKNDWTQAEYRRFRQRFVKLGIQPVPLRKNFKKNRLQSPEELLADLLAEI